jgi:hypothetical protein
VAAQCNPYVYDGTLPGDVWTKVTLPWGAFAENPRGSVPFSPRKLVGIAFAFDTRLYGGTVSAFIDDIEFVGGGPTTLPRTCPSMGGAAGAGSDHYTWQMAGAAGSIAGLPTCDGTPGP